MDQKKIGKYIADKRKDLGLTQLQLAEKLNMSNKSVSKWERGVCLPDVSKYTELCEVLGISLNEFLAGEDLTENEIIPKSEETIINIATDSKHNKRRANFLIALMLVIVLLIFSLIGSVLNKDLDEDQNGFFDSGITYVLDNSAEARLANQLEKGDTYLYRYELREKIDHLQFCCYLYKDGYLIDKSILRSYSFTGKNDREGLIVVIDNYDKGELEFEVIVEGEDFKCSLEDSNCKSFQLPVEICKLSEWQEVYTKSIYVPTDKMRMGTEAGLLFMAYDENISLTISDTIEKSGFWPKIREYCHEIAEHDYVVYITAKYWDDEWYSQEESKTPMEYIKTFHDDEYGGLAQ